MTLTDGGIQPYRYPIAFLHSRTCKLCRNLFYCRYDFTDVNMKSKFLLIGFGAFHNVGTQLIELLVILS